MDSSPAGSSEDGDVPRGDKGPSLKEMADALDKRIENALGKWKQLDHSDKEVVKSFRSHYGHDMSSPEAKILPRLVDQKDWPTDMIKALLREVIGDYKDLLVNGDPIIAALQNRNHSFIQAVLDTGDPLALVKVLSPNGETYATTALHEAISRRSPLTGQMILACAVDPPALCNSSHNYTPLHLAVALAHVDDKGKTSDSASDRAHRPQTETSITKERQHGFRLMAPITYSYDTVRQLIHVCPEALLCRDAEGNTPYQLRVRKLSKRLIRRDLIASYIVQYCVRSMSHEKAKVTLYRDGEGPELSFDLIGAKTLSGQYLQTLGAHLSFEYTLADVRLPNIRLDGNISDSGSGEERVKQHYRTDYCTVFGWLREQGVEKIMSVEVLDGEEPCHSDEAIENALAGFEVERWNWQRTDIPSRVIASSTSVVREVHLYFSGKSAILEEWCGTAGGFGDCAKFPELRSIEIYLKDSGRNPGAVAAQAMCNKALSEIKRQRSRNDGRTLLVNILSERQENVSMDESRPGPILMGNSWVATAEAFARVLMGLSTPETQGTKIAVIDDGFDISESVLSGKVDQGMSFLPSQSATSDISASYFISTSGHGTIVASLICSICPMAKLYLAKIPLPTGVNSSRNITEAAAQAVHWALGHGVDIICVAWSDTRDDEDLRDAVRRARNERVPIICATLDKGHSTERAYPSDYDECISIGSADNFGNPATFVSPRQDIFLFPGLDISVEIGNETRTYSGSSVATAFACGFAGLLLSSKRLLHPDDRDGVVKFRDNLRRVFGLYTDGRSGYVNIANILEIFDRPGNTGFEPT